MFVYLQYKYYVCNVLTLHTLPHARISYSCLYEWSHCTCTGSMNILSEASFGDIESIVQQLCSLQLEKLNQVRFPFFLCLSLGV